MIIVHNCDREGKRCSNVIDQSKIIMFEQGREKAGKISFIDAWIKNCGIQFNTRFVHLDILIPIEKTIRKTRITLEAKIIRDTCSKLFDWQRIQQRVSCESYFRFVLSLQSLQNPFFDRTTISSRVPRRYPPSSHISSPNFLRRFRRPSFFFLEKRIGRRKYRSRSAVFWQTFPLAQRIEAVQISSCSCQKLAVPRSTQIHRDDD